MRSSHEIQKEYDELKKGTHGLLDNATDRAYQEAIRRAKLEEQAKDKRDFEAKVDIILNGEPISPIPFVP